MYALVLILIALFFGVAYSVGADPITAVNATISSHISTQTSLPVFNETFHIENGGCVQVNSTVDISSFGWGVPHLAYYGPYFDDFSPGNETPTYEIDLPNTVSKLSKFYIDPDIFGNRTGYWYQKYDDGYLEDAGNLRMFKVSWSTCQIENKSYTPVSVVRVNTTTPKQPDFLENRKLTDILIARGDSISLSEQSPMHWWLFGYNKYDYIYDRESTQNVLTINVSDLNNLSVGNYELDMVRPGDNGILEEYYNPEYKPDRYSNVTYKAIESPFRSVSPVIIDDYDPQAVELHLKQSIKNSIDDNLSVFKLIYQEPDITINRVDVLQNPNNETWINIRGYTNVQNGSVLTVQMDAGYYFYKQNRTWLTTAVGADPGALRQYNVMFPVEYNKLFKGFHNLTVTSATGASATVQIYKYVELPPDYVPPQYVEYIGASPFVTPEIITKTVTVPVPGPTQIVTVHDTPSDQQVRTQQESVAKDYLMYAGILIVILIITFKGGKYLLAVSRRAKK